MQGFEVQSDCLEIDAIGSSLPCPIELHIVPVTVQRVRRQRNRIPAFVADRDHEIDGQPVLMRPMGRKRPTLGMTAFPINKYQSPMGASQGLIRLDHDVGDLRMNVVPVEQGGQTAVGDEILA